MPKETPAAMAGARTRRHFTREAVGLPSRPFLYTLDQVSVLINVTVASLRTPKWSYFTSRSQGHPTMDQLIFHNIAPEGERPEWRCTEQELIRWMRRKGFRFYETTVAR